MFEMLFHYFPAFVAQVVDGSRVRLWLQHPKYDHINFDLDKTIVVDLDKTPSNSTIQWEDIEVDDYVNHPDTKKRGFTTLGPLVPQMHSAGGVYLSASYCGRHTVELARALAVPVYPPPGPKFSIGIPPAPDLPSPLSQKDLEESAVLRQGPRPDGPVTRFHGFHLKKRLSDLPDDNSEAHRYLLRVAHAGGRKSARPACVLVVEDSNLVQPRGVVDGRKSVNKGDAPRAVAETPPPDLVTPVFIEYGVASAAGLDIPKRPSASSESARMFAEVAYRLERITEMSSFNDWLSPMNFVTDGQIPQSTKMMVGTDSLPVSGGPLNVLEKGTYGEVEMIENRLQGNFVRVARAGNTLDHVLDLLLEKGAGFTELALIGHSRGRDGVLRFNGVSLSASNMRTLFSDTVCKKVAKLGIERICLLGCRTASYSDGRKALNALKQLVHDAGIKVKVMGTRGDVFAIHYSRGYGFTEQRLLVEGSVSVGDAPPIDDDPSGSGAHPIPGKGIRPFPSPGTPPGEHPYDIIDLSQIPLQRDSSTNHASPWVWKLPSLKLLKTLINAGPTLKDGQPEEVSAFLEASAQVVFVDKNVVYAFDVMKDGHEVWVRMQYADTCRRHDVRERKTYEELQSIFDSSAHAH